MSEPSHLHWKHLAVPTDPQCPGNDGTCPNKVSVRPCTGSHNLDWRGYWYESCEGPNPMKTHFICWREDIPQIGLPKFTKYKFGNHSSLLKLLNTPVTESDFVPFPPTPAKTVNTPQKKPLVGRPPRFAVDDLFDLKSLPPTPTHQRTIYTDIAEDLAVDMGLAPDGDHNSDLMIEIEQNVMSALDVDPPSIPQQMTDDLSVTPTPNNHSLVSKATTSTGLASATSSPSAPPSPWIHLGTMVIQNRLL
ncbi:hypothetical protein PQX77_021348 [Marasmius sp. AFHP31]|nr:hypothetical protein PQX77_021348 [Marasmius sp. AFHP31]